jgi:hypothetical protein
MLKCYGQEHRILVVAVPERHLVTFNDRSSSYTGWKLYLQRPTKGKKHYWQKITLMVPERLAGGRFIDCEVWFCTVQGSR